MERHFALPVTFAIAVHAALLFGFTKSPHTSRDTTFSCALKDFVLLQDESETPVVDNQDSESNHEKLTIEAPQPHLPEPVPIDPGPGLVVPVPPLQPIALGDAKTIELPSGTFGRGEGVGPGRGVIPEGLLDNPPRTRFQAMPAYPFEGKRQGLHGDVTVEFIVDERGQVREPRVMNSSHRMFEEPTLRAVAKWQFEPGRRNGQIVRFRMAVPVMFNLSE